MKLWQELKNKPLCNDFHFPLIAIVLLFISLKYWVFYFILIIYLIFLLKKTKYFTLSFVLCITIFCLVKLASRPKNIPIRQQYEGTILTVSDTYYILSIDGIKVKVYANNLIYEPGDIIECRIKWNELTEKNYETDFDYKTYLYSKGIYGQGYMESSTKKDTSFSFEILKYRINQYLKSNLSEDSYAYVKTMVLGVNELSDDLKDGYSALGISHILAISGLHILFLFKIISFFIEKLFRIYHKAIPAIIIIFYVAFLGFPPSALRALLFILLGLWNQVGQNKYTKLDIFSISFIFMAIINPLSVYQTGFILSYMVSFALIFMDELVPSESKIKKLYFSYLLIFFFTLPFVINMNNQLSMFSILFSPILGIILGYLLLPLSFILLLIPPLDFLLKYIFLGLNSYIIGLSKLNVSFSIPDISFLKMSLYYALFICLIFGFLKHKKVLAKLMCFMVYILILSLERNMYPFFRVTFISVGQGDCTVIEYPYNKGVVVIDAFNSLDYLSSLGLKKIDYLIVSHSDIDHIKDAEEMINKYHISTIYYPYCDEECLAFFGKNKAKKAYANTSFVFESISYQFLAPIKEYEDKNSNSLVVRTTIENSTFIFCGDMSVEEENDLLFNNINVDSDIIKVGHHGSITSSSLNFIKRVSPSISIISVGKNNSYGLPDEEVVKRLSAISTVYNTAKNGNITIYLYQNKRFIHSYR